MYILYVFTVYDILSILTCTYIMLSLYRAAMKMANLDAIFDFMFTGMRDKSGVSYNCDIIQYTCVYCTYEK